MRCGSDFRTLRSKVFRDSPRLHGTNAAHQTCDDVNRAVRYVSCQYERTADFDKLILAQLLTDESH
jgi:hypothetical protein